MVSVTGSEAIQLTVGALMGTALSINMDNYGLSIIDPETRWQALGLICSFLFTFLSLTDLLIG